MSKDFEEINGIIVNQEEIEQEVEHESLESEHLEEDHLHRKTRRKKIIATFSAILLIFLITSYVIVGYPLAPIIAGQLESKPLFDNRLQVDGIEISFTSDVLQEINQMYLDEQEVEFSLCLQGEKTQQGNVVEYQIDALYQPTQFTQSFGHVTFEPCSQDTLIIFHTHPYKSCLASNTDINTLAKTQEKNPDTIMLIMCEPQRFAVIS